MSTVQTNLASHSTLMSNQTILATAKVTVISEQGYQIQARALIDPGPQLSFITKRLEQQLYLKKKTVIFKLHEISTVNAGRTQGIVSFNLKPYFKSSQQINLQAHVLPKLTARIQATPRLTIPRLELSAAVLFTKVVYLVLQKFEIKDSLVHLWTNTAITHT